MNRFSKITLSIASLALVCLHGIAQVPANPLPSTNIMLQLMASEPQVDISAPVAVSATLDPAVVEPGESATFRVTVNALQSAIQVPQNPPERPGFTVKLRAQGQLFQPGANRVLRPVTTFNYDVRADKAGLFAPAFNIIVNGRPVRVPELFLSVIEEPPQPRQRARRLVVECPTNAFVGQPITLRVLLAAAGSNMVEAVSEIQFNGDGFLTSKNATRQAVEPTEVNGQTVPCFIYETTVTPISAGTLKLSAQGFTTGRLFSGPITIRGSVTIPGGPPEFLLVDSEPVTVHVMTAPSEGKLPGFTGAIGQFACDPPRLETNHLRIGDPAQLAVTIRGMGDLSRLVPPPAPTAKEWQVFDAVAAGNIGGNGAIKPGVIFRYTLIPLTDETKMTPAIPFSIFDPAKGAYVDLTIPPIPVTVTAEGMPTNFQQTFDYAGGGRESEATPALAGLTRSPGRAAGSLKPLQSNASFYLFQLIPAAAFFGLWQWDRRRRYLEAHPEVVRRRRARRELRQQRRLLQRAWADRDAAGYARSAATAIKIACAPHFPAEPRALVCRDVLSVLEPVGQNGRTVDVVQRFFAAADANDYSTAPSQQADVLVLHSELQEILQKLEERL